MVQHQVHRSQAKGAILEWAQAVPWVMVHVVSKKPLKLVRAGCGNRGAIVREIEGVWLVLSKCCCVLCLLELLVLCVSAKLFHCFKSLDSLSFSDQNLEGLTVGSCGLQPLVWDGNIHAGRVKGR